LITKTTHTINKDSNTAKEYTEKIKYPELGRINGSPGDFIMQPNLGTQGLDGLYYLFQVWLPLIPRYTNGGPAKEKEGELLSTWGGKQDGRQRKLAQENPQLQTMVHWSTRKKCHPERTLKTASVLK
jgi:hypothetical protein